MIYTIPFSLQDGTEQGPDAVVAELRKLHTGLQTKDLSGTLQQIAAQLPGKESGRVLFINASHDATLHLVRAFVQQHPGSGLVFLDAHPDAQRAYAGQQDVIRGIVAEKLIPPEKIILFGVRQILPEEEEFLKMYPGITFYTMEKIFDLGIQEACDIVMERVRQWPSFYLSIDMDVVDPAFAPGVTAPVPGGLDSRELLYLVKRLCLLKHRGWSDVCEVNPKNDIHHITAQLAAMVARYLC